MDLPTAELYFTLALDLPRRQRNEFLDKLDREEPDIATTVRALIDGTLPNRDFACHPGGPNQRRTELDVLHHIAVQVDDVACAVRWYREHFACETEYEDQSWAVLRFRNARLSLVLPEQHPSHFSVCRPDASGFGKLRTHRDGTRSTYKADPWGNTVEILDAGSLPQDRDEV